MLRSRTDFARLGASGRVRGDRLLVVHVLANGLDHDRYGISTGRRLGGAVERNRARRRVRQILRDAGEGTGPSADFLVVARPASAGATYGELRSALEELLAWARTSLMAAP